MTEAAVGHDPTCVECCIHDAEPGDSCLCESCQFVADAGHAIWYDAVVQPSWVTVGKLICRTCGPIGVAPDFAAEDQHRADAYARALVDQGVISEGFHAVAWNMAVSGRSHADIVATCGDLTD